MMPDMSGNSRRSPNKNVNEHLALIHVDLVQSTPTLRYQAKSGSFKMFIINA